MDQNLSERVTNTIHHGSDRGPVADPRDGLVHTWVENSLGIFEETVRAGFGFLDTVRTETHERIGATLDWVEGFDRSAFTIARSALERVNGIGSRIISGNEQNWLALLGAVRRTSRGATGLAFETTVSIVGERKATPYAVS